MSSPNLDTTTSSGVGRFQPRDLLQRGLAPSGPVHTTEGGESQSRTPVHQTAIEGVLEQVFPEFKIVGQIGSGGGGTVYRAEHRQLKRNVALKILSGARAVNVEAIARFEREMQASGTLDDPRIVRAFDGGQRGGIWFLTMEFVDGLDFSALSKSSKPLSISDACELVRQAALALQHAHEKNLVHRDVKPSNFMLTTDLRGQPIVKVLDFGLAQLSQAESALGDLTVTGDFLGTIDYVAPEQISDPRSVDQRADVFGLGATLYRLLTGRPPNGAAEAGSTMIQRLLSIAQRPVPSVAMIRGDLPLGLIQVVDRMLSLDRSKRFDTAQEVASALAPFAEGHQLAELLETSDREESAALASRDLGGTQTPGNVKREPAHWWRYTAIFVLSVGVAGLGFRWAPKWSWNSKLHEMVPSRVMKGPVAIHPRSLDLGPDGAFYGGTIFGGKHNLGTLFRFEPPSTVQVLVHFTGTNGATLGRMPGRQLRLGRDGFMYGVTERGGSRDLGTIFRFNPRDPSLGVSTLWEFQGTDGSEPLAGLIEDRSKDGVFYGGTQFGGDADAGTLFQLEVTGNTARVRALKQFTGSGGEVPGKRIVANLAQTADGSIYGSCPDGGAGGGGVVFRLTSSGQYSVLTSFGLPPSRLANPTGGLTLGRDGNLYGHCRVERDGYGAMFRVKPPGDVEIVARFGVKIGSEPASTLMVAPDGSLYGTALDGGEHHRGTVFRYVPGGELSRVASIYDVGGEKTELAWGTPILGPDGSIYGSFEGGGTDRAGLLYRLEADGQLRMLVQFASKPKPASH